MTLFAVIVALIVLAQLATYLNIRRARDLVADCPAVIGRVRETRELDLGDAAGKCVRCVLTRNVPWEAPRTMARVAVGREDGSVLVVDPFGSDDFVLRIDELRFVRLMPGVLPRPADRSIRATRSKVFRNVQVFLTEGQARPGSSRKQEASVLLIFGLEEAQLLGM